MTNRDVADDKRHFFAMIDQVRAKLARLAADSPIKRCLPEARLNAIKKKVEASAAKDLEWGDWQPLFLFLKRCSDEAIQAFDNDLRIVESRSAPADSRTLDFLSNKLENAQPWAGGVFEIYVKARMLRDQKTLNCMVDPKLPNGR